MSLHLDHHHHHPKPPRIVFKNDSNDDSIVSRVVIPITLDLFRSEQSPPRSKIQYGFIEPKITEKRSIEDEEEKIMMSRKGGSGEKLDLRLNLSPPPRGDESPPPSRSASVSPPRSCVSSEEEGGTSGGSMVLVGCPRCLMYVMLSKHDPKCPKCKSDVLLDFVGNNNNKNNYNGVSYKKTKKN